jgi:hypothetical protein
VIVEMFGAIFLVVFYFQSNLDKNYPKAPELFKDFVVGLRLMN